ncbi:hypothetical protein [Pontiella sp.]|uniref:hypothetical protein n=1 Tax=Pontiella sp. TaxID=2837462 RepID=UPI003561AFAF
MPSKRRYNVKGTNDFIVLAAIFFFLCLWAIKDAWYPSEKVLKKHPLEVVAAFEADGSVEKVYVSVGDAVAEEQLLAKLRTDKFAVEYEKAKTDYTEKKKKFAMMDHARKNAEKNGVSENGYAEIIAGMETAQSAMNEALRVVTDLKAQMDASVLKTPSKGVVKEVKMETHTLVKAGDPVVVINPKDHFYLFNKSLAIFSFFAFWIFLAIHILAR